MKFTLLIEQDETGRYVVECTDLLGCMTDGRTLDEAIKNINEAIVGCIKSRLKTASEKIHSTTLPTIMSIDLDTPGITICLYFPGRGEIRRRGTEFSYLPK